MNVPTYALMIDMVNGIASQGAAFPLRYQTVAVTLLGGDVVAVANVRLYLTRPGSNARVAVVNAFTVAGTTMIGTLDLNTTDMVAVFAGVPDAAMRIFDCYVYDVSDAVVLVKVQVRLMNAIDTANVPANAVAALLQPYMVEGLDDQGRPTILIKSHDGTTFMPISSPGG